jgi:hypothetical protein
MNSDRIIFVMVVAYVNHFSPDIPENGITDTLGEEERGGGHLTEAHKSDFDRIDKRLKWHYTIHSLK